MKNIILKIYKYFGFRTIFINYILYNKFLLFILTKINKLRWKTIDLYVIIWPPAIIFFEEILKDLSEECLVISFDRFKIKKNYFSDFLFKLYSIDNASKNKILGKLNRLQEHSNEMGRVLVRISNPDMVAVDVLNYVSCKQISNIKSKIRAKYKSRINNYIYDIIIHSTEADYQNKRVEKLIVEQKSYVNKKN